MKVDVEVVSVYCELKVDVVLMVMGVMFFLLEFLEKVGLFGVGYLELVFVFLVYWIVFVDVVGKGYVRVSIVVGDGVVLKVICFKVEDKFYG